MKLSACLIVKDEAANLPRCLASLAFADEIVVVDTGSTDGSVAIAEAAGAKIGHFAWRDDFAAARNAAIDLATGDWILIVDADEEVGLEDAAALRALMAGPPAAYLVPLRDAIHGGRGDRLGRVVRLFPRHPRLRFDGRIHESIGAGLEALGWPLLETAALHLTHHGYTPEVMAARQKPARNLRLARLAAEERPDRPLSWFDLGRSAITANKLPEALAAWERLRALPLTDPYQPQYLATLEQLCKQLAADYVRHCQHLAAGPLSACLIVKDEAANLPRCLASLQGHVDEIVVVDTGSSDDTVRIAREAGARIGHFAWCDDFAAARNAALELATGSWVLTIDADEELAVEDGIALRAAMAGGAGAYNLEIRNLDAEGRVESRYPSAPRLFRRDPAIRYEGRLHEDVSRALQARGWASQPLPGVAIRHHGYMPAVVEARDKIGRNRRLAEAMTREQPDDPDAWIHLASICWRARDVEPTLAAAARAFQLVEGGKAVAPHRLVGLAKCRAGALLAAGRPAEAHAALDRGLTLRPGHPELAYERGRLRLDLGDVAGARADFEACVAAHGQHVEGVVRAGITGFLPRTELAGLAVAAGQMEQAAAHVRAALADPACPPDEAQRLQALQASVSRLAAASPPTARQALVARLQANPREAEAYLELAFDCFQQGQLDRALVAVGQALELNATPTTYHLLGLVLADLGQPGWAERCFATVLRLDGNHPTALDARLEMRSRRATEELPAELAATLERYLALATPTLCACLIVRDEAANLGRCLASLKGLVDEIVVVDTGSTDDTLAIAEAAGAKVGHFAWCDDFAAARNAALDLATGDWILSIDADEEALVDDVEAFRALLRDRQPAAYVVAQLSLDEAGQVTHDAPALRLVRNRPELRFRGRIHEAIDPEPLGWPVFATPHLVLRHHGYTQAAMASGAKAERNARLAELDAQDAPERPAAWANLAQARKLAGDLAGARAAFERLEALPGGLLGLARPRRAGMVVLRAELDEAQGRSDEAEALLTAALALEPGFPGFLYPRGQLRAKRGDRAGAIADFEACLAAPTSFPGLPLAVGVARELPRAALAALGEQPPATGREAILAQLEADPRNAQAYLELAFDCFQQGQHDRALVAVGRSLELQAAATAYYLLGLVLAELEQPGWAERCFATVLRLAPDHPKALEARLAMRPRQVGGELPAELAATLERYLALAAPRLSACLIVKDEARHLPRCLASLRGLVDEIVVVDTGSTDATVAIAEAAGAKLGHFSWCNDFAAARNAAIDLATGDWVLAIDADEELVVPDLEALREDLRCRIPGAYALQLTNVDAQGRPALESTVVRLFQRLDGVRFQGRFQETIDTDLVRLGLPIAPSRAASMIHHGYAVEVMLARGKAQRNLELAELALADDPTDAAAWYNVALARLGVEDFPGAAQAFERLEGLDGGLLAMGRARRAHGVVHKVAVLEALERPAEIVALLTRALALEPGFPEFHFLRAQARSALGDLAGAAADLEACLVDPAPWAELPMRPGVTGELPRQVLAAMRAAAPAPAQDPEALMEQAFRAFQAGELDGALLATAQLLERSASATGYQLLGLILADLGLAAWAERCFATVLRLDPTHPTALASRLEMRTRPAGEAPPELETHLQRLLALAQPRLTACMIVKDEAANLPRALASLRGWVDEIVVVDTGSGDDTVAIAEAAGAVVGHFAWCDDFAAARNAALDLATGDWILVLDADEELVVDEPAVLTEALRQRLNGGYVVRLSNVDDRGQAESHAPLLRLFRNLPELRYRGRLHENIAEGARALGLPFPELDALRLLHHGYSLAAVAERTKGERNVRLARLDAEANPASAEARLNLARSLALAGKADEALACLAGLAATTELSEISHLLYVMTYQDLLRQALRFEEADAVLTAGLARQPGAPDLLFERGNVRYRLGRREEARADFEACIGARPAIRPLRPGVTDELPRLALAQLGRPRLGACMIVKDEAANLPRCLASLRGLVDEIVVVDTGSSDETVAIAEAAGATIGRFPWTGNFGEARNASLELATCDWVLVIDGDEELVVQDEAAFRAALAAAEVGAYIFPIHNLRDDGSFQVQPMMRLFRRHPQVRFAGRLHEEVTRAIEALGWQVRPLEGVYLRHHGYLQAAIVGRDKWTRNLQIAIAEVEARPDDPLAWYNMGRSSLFSGQTAPAEAAFGQVARLLAEGKPMGEAPFCNYVLLRKRLLVQAGQPAAAEAMLDEGLARVPGFPEFLYERALLRRDRGDVAGAIADLEACMRPTERFYTGAIRPEVRGPLPAKLLADLRGSS